MTSFFVPPRGISIPYAWARYKDRDSEYQSKARELEGKENNARVRRRTGILSLLSLMCEYNAIWNFLNSSDRKMSKENIAKI